MEQTECSETSAYKIQTPGNYPKEKHTTLNMCLEVLFFSSLGKENCYFHICLFFFLSFSRQRFYSVTTLPSKHHSTLYNPRECLRIEINNILHNFQEGRHLDPHRRQHIRHKFSKQPFLLFRIVANKP